MPTREQMQAAAERRRLEAARDAAQMRLAREKVALAKIKAEIKATRKPATRRAR